MKSLYDIVQSIGIERLAGTQGEKNAATQIINLIESCGFSAKKIPFKVKTFNHQKAILKCGKEVFEGIAFGCCESSKTTAELIFTENPKVVNLAPEMHRGKILVTYGRPRGLYHQLKNSGIAGMITICPPFKGTQRLSHRQHEKNLVPAMTLNYDDCAKLADLNGKKATLEIHQEVKTATAYNIEVSIKGTQNDGGTTYFVGHYDTVLHSPGACDNAGGTAVLLHLINYWHNNPPRRDVKVIFFSGEELGLLGSQDYCLQNEKKIQELSRLVVNIDVTGDDLGMNELYITGSKELLGFASGIARIAGEYCNSRLALYSSDSIPFARLGIPSINLARYGGKASYYGHTPDDAPCFITQRGLESTYKVAEALARALTQGVIYPVDKEIDHSLREELEAYIFGLTGQDPEIKWLPKYK